MTIKLFVQPHHIEIEVDIEKEGYHSIPIAQNRLR